MLWASSAGRLPNEIQEQFKETLQENIQYGCKLTIDDVYDTQIQRTIIFENVQSFLSNFDVLAMPVVGLRAQQVEKEYPEKICGVPVTDYLDWLKFSFLSTTTSHPSISIPAGFTGDGMPVGIQFIGHHRGEAKLLQVARAFERTVGFPCGPIDPR